MGAGLGFPVGVSAPLRFHPQPPICQDKLVKKNSFVNVVIIELLNSPNALGKQTSYASEYLTPFPKRYICVYYNNV